MPPKSKPGEGIVIIIDVGPAVRASTETTFYSQAKECLINILQRKIFAEKCKDMVGIVLFGTDETRNKLATKEQYKHITVLQTPKFVDWNMISLAENLPRGNSQGDWLDAIVVAMDLLYDPDGVLFSNQKIVLMTDFNCEFSDDQTKTIICGLKNMNIELSVIGPSMNDDDGPGAFMDDDDASNSMAETSNSQSQLKSNFHKNIPGLNWNGKVKSRQQLAAECLIKRIINEVEGIICSFDEAIPQLIFFEKKSQGSSNWNAMMDIGPNFQIPVVGKIKIKHATTSSWKRVYVGDENAAIISETSYHKRDETQTVVDERDIISGYKYGTTLVPFGDEDQTLKYTCDAPGAVLSVLGFTRSSYVPLSLRSGDQVLIVTAKDGDEDGAVALSAVIQALNELDMVAITRRVYRKNLNPVLGTLFPDITTDYECLIWVALPFQEDVRNFAFPSLDTAMEKITDDQRDVMDQLITSMDLSAKDDDDEELDPTVVVNPQLQHYYNCLTKRAIAPEEPIPAPQQHILDLLSPPAEQRQARDLLASKLKELFPTKKIEIKKKKVDVFANSKTNGNQATTSNEDIELTSSDLTRGVITKISTVTPVEDFRVMLTSDLPNYNLICQQMENVILQLIENLSGIPSTDRIIMPKIIDSVKVFRTEAVIINPVPFNSFIKLAKQTVVARSHMELWSIIKQDNLGLISQSETLKSSVSKDEVEAFWQVEESVPAAVAPADDVEDFNDMLDDF